QAGEPSRRKSTSVTSGPTRAMERKARDSNRRNSPNNAARISPLQNQVWWLLDMDVSWCFNPSSILIVIVDAVLVFDTALTGSPENILYVAGTFPTRGLCLVRSDPW